MSLTVRNLPVSFISQAIRDGSVFNATIKNLTLADAASLDFLINPNGAFVTIVFQMTAEGNSLAELFENTIVSNNGTPIEAKNRNRNSDTTSSPVTQFDTPTVTNAGDLVAEALLGGGEKKDALINTIRTNPEMILKKDALSMLRLTNQSGADSIVSIGIAYFVA